jgi:hypothetical protein
VDFGFLGRDTAFIELIDHPPTFPRDDLGLSAEQLAGLDPVRRQLLGAGTSAIGYWIPTEEDVPLRAIG